MILKLLTEGAEAIDMERCCSEGERESVRRDLERATAELVRLQLIEALAKRLLTFEYPRRGSERAHPHPHGRMLWSELREALDQ